MQNVDSEALCFFLYNSMLVKSELLKGQAYKKGIFPFLGQCLFLSYLYDRSFTLSRGFDFLACGMMWRPAGSDIRSEGLFNVLQPGLKALTSSGL